ncbi:MAG TPA: SRPBCC family protein [Nitrospiraceae bacterium]|nr:SRPBCC family protein [Nitrospiraceae bacterium]
MATIEKRAKLQVAADTVWQRLRDVGNAATIFPDVLSSSHAVDGARVVTFTNGMVVTELIVDIDDNARRLAYAAQGNGFLHHNASMQVIADSDESCTFVWITDFLPNELLDQISALIEAGVESFVKQWDPKQG